MVKIGRTNNNLHQTIETILTYNVKVTHNIKISYIKNNNLIIRTLSEKSCPKSVPGLTNMPKQ